MKYLHPKLSFGFKKLFGNHTSVLPFKKLIEIVV